MARNFDLAITKAMTADSTDEAFLILLKVAHSDFTNIRLVNNTKNITSNGQVFTAFPFALSLPADTDDVQPAFKVSIANADLSLIDDLRGVAGGSTRVTCDISVIAASDPDTIMAEWTDFELTDVSYNADILTFSLSIDWLLAEGFPQHSFSPGLFPGIF